MKKKLFGPMDQGYVWRRKNKTYTEKSSLSIVNHGGGTVMLWGCYASSGTGNMQHLEARWIKSSICKSKENCGEPTVRKQKLGCHWNF